ncbi:hypothetical protein DFH28DRAFT_225438 [Melampsora americana]|nr:hypothetical protein DFH28DRAFT_225438 [Melampsora americana]
MAVSSTHTHAQQPNTGLREKFLDMAGYNGFHSLVPNHSPSATSGSDHSVSVSPPSFANHEHPTLSDHTNNSIFPDEDELEDDSFESVGMPSKFYPTFHSHGQKKDSKIAAQSNRLKNTTAERRATHNAIERARRESLNGRFLELARALPTMGNVKRPSKSVIVNKSLEWISESQMREFHLIRENNYLRAQVNELRSQLRLSPLPPTTYGDPVHVQPKAYNHYRPPNLFPSGQPIVLPVASPSSHAGSHLPPPAPLSVNDTAIDKPTADKLPPPSISPTFNFAHKDNYTHATNQVVSPFNPQHQRAQSYSTFATLMPLVASADPNQLAHDTTDITYEQHQNVSQVGPAALTVFQSEFDSKPTTQSEENNSSPINPYHPAGENGEANDLQQDVCGFNANRNGSVTGTNDGLLGNTAPQTSFPLSMFGTQIGGGSTESSHQLSASGFQSHHHATLPPTERGSLGESIADLLQVHSNTRHLPDHDPNSSWSENAFASNMSNTSGYIF